MEVTAFIIELSAEVVKGIQGGNEYWMMNNGKLRGEELEGMVWGEGCAFEKVVRMERLVSDPSVLRQIGLSEY